VITSHWKDLVCFNHENGKGSSDQEVKFTGYVERSDNMLDCRRGVMRRHVLWSWTSVVGVI
jgi:hypothetical protein